MLVTIRLLMLCALVLVPAMALAQGEKKDPKVDAAAEFNKLLAELNAVSSGMEELREQYAQAKPEARPALETKFRELAKKGQELFPKLRPAAEKALLADPDPKKEHARFLVDNAQDLVRTGQFTEANKLLKLLVENKFDSPEMQTLGAMSTLCSGDDAAAKKFLEKAKVDGQLTKEAAKIQRELDFRAADAKAGNLPRVKLQTEKGDVVIELFEDQAPNTVANFVSLVAKGFYDNLVFHRVIDGFMAQGGDPTGTGGGGPGYAIPCECESANHREHFFGTLSMAHAGKDTGGSQFFLTFGPTAHLDGKHTAFGRVIEGGEVLAKITRIQPGEPGKPDKIVKATVLRKRDHEYKPKTLPDPRPGK